MSRYYEKDVDEWVFSHGEHDAWALLRQEMPRITRKLEALDKKLIEVLAEIRTVFPDAEYYTAGGGFTVVLGATHEGHEGRAQQHRSAWGGHATIGDGDW